MTRSLTCERIASWEARLALPPGALKDAITDAGLDECDHALRLEVDASNERLRLLDPADGSLRAWTTLAGERRAAKFAPRRRSVRPRHLAAVPEEDVLLAVTPTEYVEALTGEEVPPSGMARCPFHEDRTPSLRVYEDVAGGWFCFGCQRGGTIYDFGAALFELGTRGSDFIELRRRLAAALLGREAA
jgi:hypothetical protein